MFIIYLTLLCFFSSNPSWTIPRKKTTQQARTARTNKIRLTLPCFQLLNFDTEYSFFDKFRFIRIFIREIQKEMSILRVFFSRWFIWQRKKLWYCKNESGFFLHSPLPSNKHELPVKTYFNVGSIFSISQFLSKFCLVFSLFLLWFEPLPNSTLKWVSKTS